MWLSRVALTLIILDPFLFFCYEKKKQSSRYRAQVPLCVSTRVKAHSDRTRAGSAVRLNIITGVVAGMRPPDALKEKD